MRGGGSVTVDAFLARFDQQTQTGGQWLVRRPGHDDRHASLAVREGAEGRILLTCHAGCARERVLNAMGLKDADLFGGEAVRTSVERRIVQTYPYHDECGVLLYETVRYEPKGFRQRRPDGDGRWIWNLKGARLVLYRLPDLQGKQGVAICAGEKDADSLAALGIPATTNPLGELKWRDAFTQQLVTAGVKRVRIFPDNDDTGRRHADAVARSCHDAGIVDVKVAALPGLSEKGDVSDYLQKHSKADLLEIVAASASFDPTTIAAIASGQPESSDDSRAASVGTIEAVSRPGKASQASTLADLVHEDGIELFHTPEGEPFFSIPVKVHIETYPLKGSFAREWLSRRFYQAERRTPNNASVQDALGMLRGEAKFAGPEIAVCIRVGGTDRDIYLDLGDDTWRVVHIDATGWRVVPDCPVRFRRPRGVLPLPVPVRGGCITDLRSLVNVGSDDDFALVVAWLVASLRPTGPYPNLVIAGEAGSAKSSLSRVLRRCVDPNTADLRSEPRDARDLMIAASNSRICCFDNVSRLPDWLSDALCRLATGGGFATRLLYSDDEEMLFDVMRPVLLNSIGDVVQNGDLLDRGVAISAPVIPDANRRPEESLWSAFAAAHPRILGALLTGVAEGVRRLPDMQFDAYPRMADFFKWGVATESAWPWPTGRFLAAYTNNRREAIDLALDGDPLADCAKAVAPWSGSATELLERLDARDGGTTKGTVMAQDGLSALQQAEAFGAAAAKGRGGRGVRPHEAEAMDLAGRTRRGDGRAGEW
jgi:hypothetical protein